MHLKKMIWRIKTMKSMIVSREVQKNIYLVKRNNQTILYAPFKEIVVKGLFAKLASHFITFSPDIHQVPEVLDQPTTVTFDLTHLCSLGCIYCSVDSGRDKVKLSTDATFATIDYLTDNAKKMKHNFIGVVFGGGGEPALAWPALTRTIEYTLSSCAQHNIEPQIIVATSGILDEEKIIWLANHVSHIALSFDGMQNVQNTHRPLFNRQGSFGHVRQTAKILCELNADFSIRAAVSELNKDLIALIDFLSEFKPKLINLQPVVECGRCLKIGWKSIDPDTFVERFLAAKKYAKKQYDIPVIFPGARIERLIPEMCHAYNGTGLVVTNRGLISACERVLEPEAPLSSNFLYGRISDKKLEIDTRQLERLKAIKVDQVPFCKNCFCRWHCCGGCLNDHLSQPESGDNPFSDRTNVMCYIAREIVWHQLSEITEAKGGK